MRAQVLSIISLLVLLLTGCITVEKTQKSSASISSNITFELTEFKKSDFKQVQATFDTSQSRLLVFRVLSDIKQTSKWLARVESVDVVTVYNNHQYLLRTIINSPWPFKNRELITCVDTFFDELTTRINIYGCSDRVPLNELYVRISRIESSWMIRKKSDALVEVSYKTWIDPAGNVPAFIFNRELINNTKTDLIKLQTIIDSAVLSDYPY